MIWLVLTLLAQPLPNGWQTADRRAGGCTSGQVLCYGTCIDLNTSKTNCGVCGNICTSGQLCSAGTCTNTCLPSQSLCSGSCSTLATDSANCGGCGVVCAQNQYCASGVCTLSPFGAGFDVTMPNGVPDWKTTVGSNKGFFWSAASPTVGLLGDGTTTACTANASLVTNKTPFCPAGTAPTSTCSVTQNFQPSESGYVTFTFPVSVGQPASGNFSACVAANMDANSTSTLYIGTNACSGSTGWYIEVAGTGQGGAGKNQFNFNVNDGGGHTFTFTHSDTASGTNLYCATFTHAGSSYLYKGSSQIATGANTNVGSLTSTVALGMGCGSVLSSAQGFWYFPYALSGAEVTTLATAWASNGLGAPNPMLFAANHLYLSGTVAWLTSNPYINAANPNKNPSITTQAGYGFPVTSPPWCGSSQGSGACLTSQWFLANNGTPGQYFDCGNVGQPGTGTSSPANDFSLCVVERGYQTGQMVGTSSYYLNMTDNRVGSAFPYDCHFMVGAGTDEGYGAMASGYGDYVVCCGAFQMDDGTVNSHACEYQNGVLGGQVNGLSICDTAFGGSQNVHHAGHFYIGRDSGGTAGFSGDIVGVWYWPLYLTQAQMTAFAAPWISGFGASSTGSGCQIINGQWICKSAGM